jgi:Ser/Thr protein kinase RdoA (MazF antagonist)
MPDALPPALSPQALLSEVISHYDIPGPSECTLLVSGYHDTFLVSAGEGRFVLKIYRLGTKTRADVLAEIDALLYLGRKGVRIALPVMRRDGAYAWSLSVPGGERQALLFTYARGKSVSALDEASCRLLGRALAGIHSAGSDFDGGPSRFDLEQMLDQPIRMHEPLLRQRPDDWRYLLGLAQRLRERIAGLPAAALDWGFCHGEFNTRHNHLDEETGLVTSFDFEGCGPGYRAYDLAVFRFLLGLGKGDPSPEQLWEAYLEGYAQGRPLQAIDREAIPLFVPVRPISILGNIIRTHKPRLDGGLPNPDFFDQMLKFLRAWEERHLLSRPSTTPW